MGSYKRAFSRVAMLIDHIRGLINPAYNFRRTSKYMGVSENSGYLILGSLL